MKYTWKKTFKYAALLVVSLALAAVMRYQIPALENLALQTVDWRFEWRGVENIDDSPIVLVVIDDASFNDLPARWPWPRSYYAHLIDNLTRAGAAAIGIDVIFDVPEQGGDSDAALARAVRESGKTVLAQKLGVHPRGSYISVVDPAPELADAAAGRMGLVTIVADPDGIYRRYQPVAMHPAGDSLLTSFALEVLGVYMNLDPNEEPFVTESTLLFGDLAIPLDVFDSMPINYAGPRETYSSFSFVSVVDDSSLDLGLNDLQAFDEQLLPDEVFRDKIVLVGSTVPELHDNFPAPFLDYTGVAVEMPGVEIHANALNTILQSTYLINPDLSTLFIITALLSLLVLILCARLSIRNSVLVTLTVLLAYNIFQFILFSEYRIVLDMVLPTLAIAFTFVSTSLYQYAISQREKQEILGAFQHYVPEKVVSELMADPEKLSLGGEERVMTVLFSDLADFTTISENLSPRELVQLLNDYLSEMTEIVFDNDGIVDKFEGDALMAEFGAPVFYEDHALKACHAALEMQARLRILSEKWKREGRPLLSCRIGINTGNMIVGNMGSRKVFDYTVIGDNVNLASRLEGANKAFGTQIMISDATHSQVKDAVYTRPLDLIRVKGKNRPVQVFELFGRRDKQVSQARLNLAQVYTTGIQYYHQREWKKAQECFRFCLKSNPHDGPSRLYLQRSTAFEHTPPSPEWDGVFELKSK